MNFNKLLVPVAVIVLTIGAWRQFGWAGIALAAGGVVMWTLLHFTRLMTILKKAADRPVGHVGSAVMLNAKLREGLRMLDVLEQAGFSRRQCYPHGGHLINLHIVTGLGLGGCESYPGVFQPFGGFADNTPVVDGYVTMPEIPGVGFEAKATLFDLMRKLVA